MGPQVHCKPLSPLESHVRTLPPANFFCQATLFPFVQRFQVHFHPDFAVHAILRIHWNTDRHFFQQRINLQPRSFARNLQDTFASDFPDGHFSTDKARREAWTEHLDRLHGLTTHPTPTQQAPAQPERITACGPTAHAHRLRSSAQAPRIMYIYIYM